MTDRGEARAERNGLGLESLAFVDLVREGDQSGRVVVAGDEHRLCVEQDAEALADEFDDRLELELTAEGQADLVDQRQLGVALARLLDGPDAAQRGADVLADEGEEVPVGFACAG